MLALLAVLACAHPSAPEPSATSTTTSAGTPSSSEATSSEATAPYPYTPDQIRDAFPAGTVMKYRLETPPDPPVEQWTTFTVVDASGATLHSEVHGPDGAILKDGGESHATWAELHEHAAFPAASTTRTDAEIDVPAGHFSTWLYEVHRVQDDGKDGVERYWFPKDVAGPPVLLTVDEGGQTVFRMTLLSRVRGGTGPG